eukprot:SAG11_NODE_8857_length_969_cov_1.203448_1_plen_100_part_00
MRAGSGAAAATAALDSAAGAAEPLAMAPALMAESMMLSAAVDAELAAGGTAVAFSVLREKVKRRLGRRLHPPELQVRPHSFAQTIQCARALIPIQICVA